MTRWAMVADLDRCVGCQTCTAACRHANATSPGVEWRKVLDVEAGAYPNVSRTFVPIGCQHCDDPPCTHVCPSGATYRRDDGIVVMDYDVCIGCAYCDVACPYQARFKIDAPHFAYGGGVMKSERQREEPRRLGVAQKCTFCSDRIDFGLSHGLTPGVDHLATPACVNACIADALHFGDVDDPNSNVSRLLREQKHFRMHQQLGTDPAFYYVYHGAESSDDAAAPALAATPLTPAMTGQIRSRSVEPSRQRHWDWKAAGNFMCGGTGGGLLAFAAAATLLGAPDRPALLAAVALLALGLLLVLLKIGRPLRSLNVLRRPRRSWMAREAWVAMLLFPISGLAVWSPDRPSAIAAAGAGLAFLFCQAMILRAAKGIPAWREPVIVGLIVTSGLTEGGGLLLATLPFVPMPTPIAETVAVAVVALSAARGWSWRRYVRALGTKGAPRRTLDVIEHASAWLLSLELALPAAAILIGFILRRHEILLFALGGFSAFAAGWLLKFMLVTRAAYNQGFALHHVPRGRGTAGRSIKPGWFLP